MYTFTLQIFPNFLILFPHPLPQLLVLLLQLFILLLQFPDLLFQQLNRKRQIRKCREIFGIFL